MATKEKYSSQKFKSFISTESDSSVVYKSLLGTALANNNLVVLDNQKIILRRDHRTMTGKVKILAGGAAGLEPAEAGCIGQGMLTGAVLGEMFVAPPASSILIAIRELAYEHPDGVLLLVKNYLGDKLNFGLAMERALKENITIKMLLIGDDSANPNPGKYGRRGMAGSVLVYKIAGAMAEVGKSLDDIFDICRDRVLTDLSTISMCLSPSGYLKWQNIQCQGSQDEAIIGIGAYGQPGKKINYDNLNDIINAILDIVTDSSSKTSVVSDDKLTVALVNNLGATSKLEEGVICTEIVNELSSRNFKICRFYSGTFMSLADSKGFSLSLLKVTDPETLRFLDYPTAAHSWPKSYFCKTDEIFTSRSPKDLYSSNDTAFIVQPVLNHDELDAMYQIIDFGPAFSDNSKQIIQQIVSFAAEALISCEKQINIIDSETGDGDAGTMLRNGAVAVKEALEENQINLKYPFKMLLDLGKIVENIGGVTGALYSIFFSSASEAFQSSGDVSLKLWSEAFKSGVKAMKYYGGGEPGERTMLDALCPLVNVFEMAVEKDEEINRTVSNIACFCEFYAEETKKMKPSYVRGSYTKDNLLYPDAGAHAAAVWIRAVSEGVKLNFPKFLSEKEALFLLRQDTSKQAIITFFDDKLGKDEIREILLYDTVLFCRKSFGNNAEKTSSLMGIMYNTHSYTTASRWRTPRETYHFFRESILRHSVECAPGNIEIFSPEEAKEALFFFIEIYLRNLPLIHLVCLPHYKLRLKVRNPDENPPSVAL